MAADGLLQPTLHVEVQLKVATTSSQQSHEVCSAVKTRLIEDYEALEVGQKIECLDDMEHEDKVSSVEIADYTGPVSTSGFHALADVNLDVKSYMLRPEREADPRRRAKQLDEGQLSHMRILALPNVSLHDTWISFVFDDALPARLLRYLVRMVDLMSQPDLNLSAFNWNRLCLLHGPPGSGKSTLCRALAQKLSIRLGNAFDKAIFIEINTNSLLSKYFGESGKQIGSTFDHIYGMCQDRKMLVCVVMDEVETIAGSRERAVEGTECSDGLRATNQLLTALDRLRNLPNVIVLCTSNLIKAIDPAFLDRVDIKQFIPSPSASAVYNIFRSCLNELVHKNVIKSETVQFSSSMFESSSNITVPNQVMSSSSPHKPNTRAKARLAVKASTKTQSKPPTSSPEPWTLVNADEHIVVPTLAEMEARSSTKPDPKSVGERVWVLAQRCRGFSGRTLRRLPVLGLTMYTWGGQCSLADAISALEKAIEQELAAVTKNGPGTRVEEEAAEQELAVVMEKGQDITMEVV